MTQTTGTSRRDSYEWRDSSSKKGKSCRRESWGSDTREERKSKQEEPWKNMVEAQHCNRRQRSRCAVGRNGRTYAKARETLLDVEASDMAVALTLLCRLRIIHPHIQQTLVVAVPLNPHLTLEDVTRHASVRRVHMKHLLPPMCGCMLHGLGCQLDRDSCRFSR